MIATIIRKIRCFLNRIDSPINKIWLQMNGCTIQAGLVVKGRVFIDNRGKVTIGKNCRINSAWWANPIGGNYKTMFQVFPGGIIEIGKNCGISNTCITSSEFIHIGDNVLIGAGSRIYDTDFHPINFEDRIQDSSSVCKVNKKPIIISNGVFIGQGVTILKGVTIGENSVVGAGAVVTRSIPANEIWGGNPAKCIRKIESNEFGTNN